MIVKNHNEVWKSCLKVIKDNIPSVSFKNWFEPIIPVKLEDKVLTIQVPSHFFYEWIEEHYVDLLKKALDKELGKGSKLEYNIIVENDSAKTSNPYMINIPGSRVEKIDPSNASGGLMGMGSYGANPLVYPLIHKRRIDSNLNTTYRFENFVEGDCNNLARSAGFAVANKPAATAFNPFLIFGGVGLGKTHLAHAIGNKVKEIHGDKKAVYYISSEKFIGQYIEACKKGTNSDFINFYHMIDVLIVEDVQFFAKKEKTQEIFFQIFNHLHQNGKQIILTSDRSPSDIQDVDARLLSRFKWGLSADLQTPDFETRIAILENKMYEDGIEMPFDVVEYLAHNIDTNIRELEGALISLLAQASLNHKDIDIELAKKMMKNFVKQSSKEVSIDSISKTVADYYNLSLDLLKSKTRKREIVQARQIAMFFSKQMTNSPLKKIGMNFGGRDHSTVIHACNTVNDLLDTDKRFKDDVEEISKRIKLSSV